MYNTRTRLQTYVAESTPAPQEGTVPIVEGPDDTEGINVEKPADEEPMVSWEEQEAVAESWETVEVDLDKGANVAEHDKEVEEMEIVIAAEGVKTDESDER